MSPLETRMEGPGPLNVQQDTAASLQRLADGYDALRRELAKAIIGQDQVVEQLLLALFCRGHCILEGVPGLAKTLLISSLARCLALSFRRIQFTPDLMPADVTGTEVIQEDRATGNRSLHFVRGPIFANAILADEINRTPPKTQAALLEAMQERQVTVGGRTYPLEEPFIVMATQNPIEQEGTYPLPEAQLDRFMFKVVVGYPTQDEERRIVELTTGRATESIVPVLDGPGILALQQIVRQVPCARHVTDYALRLARATRPSDPAAPGFVRQYVGWGAGPRASQYLVLAGKARAILRGRTYVAGEDIQAVARPVLRHRLVLNFSAEADRINVDAILDQLLAGVAAAAEGAAVEGLHAGRVSRDAH
jgi:MoxR-like ATPase